MTLTEFVLARIAEDEATANAVPTLASYEQGDYGARFISFESDHSNEDTIFVTRFDPARVLAECAAKRTLAGMAHEVLQYGDESDAGEDILRLLASPYADHPDYDKSWAV